MATNAFSIVFSCWTRSLDLVGKLLQARGIRFARIDGSLTLSQRQRMLEDFENDSSVSILIMTTGTGATGSVPQSLSKNHLRTHKNMN